MPTETVNTSSAFLIEELTGPGRSIRLVDRALPYRPFTLRGKQRAEVTFYPGNPVGTGNVMGPEEDETTINGWWKDVFLGVTTQVGGGVSGASAPFVASGEPVRTAMRAAQVVDELRRAGQLLQVTWDQITRHGYLVDFEQSWHNTRDLEWRITFRWASQGENLSPAVFTAETSVGDTTQQMRLRAAELREAADPGFALDSTLAGNLATALGTVDRTVAQLADASTNLARAALTPFDATRRAVAACTGLVAEAEGVVAVMQTVAPRTARTDYPDPALMSLGVIVEAETYAFGITRRARVMRREAAVAANALARQIRRELLATHRARDGEDLRDVSQRYYGTPFEWRRLLVFNELATAELRPNQLVLVPPLQAGGEV